MLYLFRSFYYEEGMRGYLFVLLNFSEGDFDMGFLEF